jgi:hypothetical protein
MENELENTGVLLDEYDAAMKLILDKLRPFTYNHQQSIIALHKHYNTLLEQERQEKLEQSLEHARWQAGLGKVADYARQALRAHNESSLPWLTKCQELKHENKVMRRLLGWKPLPDESEDEEEGNGGSAHVGSKEGDQGSQGQISMQHMQQQLPQQRT